MITQQSRKAAAVSFLVAAVNNFLWNRTWTFAARGRRWLGQCLRALFVSSLSLDDDGRIQRYVAVQCEPAVPQASGTRV